MSFLGKIFGVDDLTAAVRESNGRLDAATQSLKTGGEMSDARLQTIARTLMERETPEIIQGAIISALQKSELSNALVVTRKQLESVDSTLKNATVHPIPVQSFPLVDDMRFEKEKQLAAFESAKRFVAAGNEFIDKLNGAHRPVDKKMEKFFTLIDQHVENRSKNHDLDHAMKELLDCSPKRVIAAFQKYSLEAGVAFVQTSIS